MIAFISLEKTIAIAGKKYFNDENNAKIDQIQNSK
jgi:hypothetical protein